MPTSLAFEKPKYKPTTLAISQKPKPEQIDLRLCSGKLIWMPNGQYGYSLAKLKQPVQLISESELLDAVQLDWDSLEQGEHITTSDVQVKAGDVQRVSLDVQQRYSFLFEAVKATRSSVMQKLSSTFQVTGRSLNSDAEALLLVKEVGWFKVNSVVDISPQSALIVGQDVDQSSTRIITDTNKGKMIVLVGECSSVKSRVTQSLIPDGPFKDAYTVVKSFISASINQQQQLKAAFMVIDSQIKVSCLDRSRVTYAKQSFSDRNFNILYEVLTRKDPQLAIPSETPAYKFKYLLSGTVEPLNFANKVTSQIKTAPKPKLQEDYQNWTSSQTEFVAALTRLKFSEQDITLVFKLLAAVLHIGNIEVQANKVQCFITTEEWIYAKDLTLAGEKSSVNLAATLLGFTGKELSELILFKQVADVKKPNSLQECLATRDALARVLYEKTLEFVLVNLNKHLSSVNKLEFGLLETPGYQIFGIQSFDNFCSNYLFERVQQVLIRKCYNDVACQLNDEGYSHKYQQLSGVNKLLEGLASSTEFIGSLKASLMSNLDDAIRTPEANDQRMLLQMHKTFHKTLPEDLLKFNDPQSDAITKQVAQYSRARKEDCFVVRHFNEQLVVVYKGTQFCDKNNDAYDQMIDIVLAQKYASKQVMTDVFQSVDMKRKSGAIFVDTFTARYRKETNELVRVLGDQNIKALYCLDPTESLQVQCKILNMTAVLQHAQLQPVFYPLLELINACRPHLETLKLPWELQNPISFGHACMSLAGVPRGKYWIGKFHIMTSQTIQGPVAKVLNMQASEKEYEKFALDAVAKLYAVKWKQLYCGVVTFLRYSQLIKPKSASSPQRPRSMFDLAANMLASQSRGQLNKSLKDISKQGGSQKDLSNLAQTKPVVGSPKQIAKISKDLSSSQRDVAKYGNTSQGREMTKTQSNSLYTRISGTADSGAQNTDSRQSLTYSLYDEYTDDPEPAEDKPTQQNALNLEDLQSAAPQEALPSSPQSPELELEAILPPPITAPSMTLPEMNVKMQKLVASEASKEQFKELKAQFVLACQSQMPVSVPQENQYFQLPNNMQVEYVYVDGQHMIARQIDQNNLCNLDGVKALKKDRSFNQQLKMAAQAGKIVFNKNAMLQLPVSKLYELKTAGFLSEFTADQFETNWSRSIS